MLLEAVARKEWYVKSKRYCFYFINAFIIHSLTNYYNNYFHYNDNDDFFLKSFPSAKYMFIIFITNCTITQLIVKFIFAR